MSANMRLKLGVALLILGLVMPFGAVLVAGTSWPAEVKAVISGILLFGLEIMAIPAAALMGKENYNRIVAHVKTLFKRIKPPGDVGRTRYRIGLVLFVVPTLAAWIATYLPSWPPPDYQTRLVVNLAVDAAFVVSLFVLGGDFWDKLRALFVHDARAAFPSSVAAEETGV